VLDREGRLIGVARRWRIDDAWAVDEEEDGSLE
jgi:hypothetical protein